MEDRKTMGEFGRPSLNGIRNSVVRPDVTAKNFEIKSHILNMIQNNLRFLGDSEEDPNQHITEFLEICDMFKIDGMSDDAVRLRLFPLSLRGRAKRWLESLPANSLTTWEKLADEFLSKYFSEAKTAQLVNNIVAFKQGLDESLEEAWDRFQDMLHKCPHHGLLTWHLVQTFYNGLDHPTKQTIRAAANGSLKTKTPDEAYDLICNLAAHEDRVPETTEKKKVRFEEVKQTDTITEMLKEMRTLSVTTKGLSKRLEKIEQPSQSNTRNTFAAGIDTDEEEEVFFSSSDYRDFPEVPREPYRPPYRQQYNNYNQNNDRWRANNQGNDRWRQNQGNPTYNQGQGPKPQQAQTSDTKLDQMMELMKNSTKDTEINSKSIKALEKQIGQIAEQLIRRAPGSLPSTTQVNPQHQARASSSNNNAQVNQVNVLRSGKTYNEVPKPTTPEPDVIVEEYVSSDDEECKKIPEKEKEFVTQKEKEN